jgi:hypothetical protein
MNRATALRLSAAALAGTILAGCYESTPFPADDDDAATDRAGEIESTADVPDAPEDDGGAETTECPTGLTRCGGECVDPASDPVNCGSCGNVCPWGGTDPGLNELGCLDPSLGTYQSCCAGSCVAPSNDGCTGCGMPCDTGRCSGLWSADTATCEFACLALLGAAGDSCTGPEDCTGLPSPDATCVTSAGPFFFEGGYCTVVDCTGDDECGSGAECVNLMRTRVCLRTCAGDDGCASAEGYVCETLPRSGAGPYCIPPMGG